MSFVLTSFSKYVNTFVAIPRDVILKKSFKEPLILCFAFFFLPRRLPKISGSGARSRCVIHLSHTTKKNGRTNEEANST